MRGHVTEQKQTPADAACPQHCSSALLGDVLIVKRTHISSNLPVKLCRLIMDIVDSRDVLLQHVITPNDAAVCILGKCFASPTPVAIKKIGASPAAHL